MWKFENESGYSSDDSVTDTKVEIGNCCEFCKKIISGPRIGFIVHLATRHTDKPLLEISKNVKGSEMRQIVSARKRTIQRFLQK